MFAFHEDGCARDVTRLYARRFSMEVVKVEREQCCDQRREDENDVVAESRRGCEQAL